jgi:vacuolar-type H+-ATPase subunit B/Vma2
MGAFPALRAGNRAIRSNFLRRAQKIPLLSLARKPASALTNESTGTAKFCQYENDFHIQFSAPVPLIRQFSPT